MENNDKLFEQIKSAETGAETREFPGFEAVWSRVEDKLDNKVLVKQNRKWKQWAVAASVVAVVSIGFQFLKTERQPDFENAKIKIVANDTVQPVFESENAVANAVADTTIIRKDAPQLLEEAIGATSVTSDYDAEIQAPVPAAVADDVQRPEPSAEAVVGNTNETQSLTKEKTTVRDRGNFQKGHLFKARSVKREDVGYLDELPKQAQPAEAKKAAPLFIVDGKPIVAKSEADYRKKLDKAVSEIEAGGRDSIIHLTEPLYIINGVEYSEESLFGPNPTSPYAPLNLQEEGMTTLIVTGDEAVRQYGRKGRNGVVIITTKNGKPAQPGAQPNTAKPKK